MSTLQDLNQVLSRKQDILSENAAGVEKQKKSGKLTARERVALLLDGGSFMEQSMLFADAGVVTGSGTVDGRPVYVVAQDFTVMNGAVGANQAKKIVKVLELARKTGTPVVAMCDSNGARVGEGAAALEAYADIFAHMARLSGVVPMITMVLGPCVGAAAMMAQLSDIVVVAKAGALLAAGPQVLSSTMGKDLKAEELGGAKIAVENGMAHFACETEEEAFAKVKTVLGMIPANNLEDAPFSIEEDMNRAVEGLSAGADGREVIAKLADTGSVVEFGEGFTGAVTALAKLAGRTVAFVYTGKGDTCDKRMNKLARFVRFADCYNIPVVSLIDSTGFQLFKTVDRQMSVVKAASQLVYAYSEATTVKVALVIGNAIGAMYVAMGGSANSDATYAWPGACISPMTGEAAIQVMWKDEIKNSTGDAVAARAELAAKYESEVADGVNAAACGLVDDVIDPADSRKMVIAALELLSSKRDSNPPKKHGNMPL